MYSVLGLPRTAARRWTKSPQWKKVSRRLADQFYFDRHQVLNTFSNPTFIILTNFWMHSWIEFWKYECKMILHLRLCSIQKFKNLNSIWHSYFNNAWSPISVNISDWSVPCLTIICYVSIVQTDCTRISIFKLVDQWWFSKFINNQHWFPNERNQPILILLATRPK